MTTSVVQQTSSLSFGGQGVYDRCTDTLDPHRENRTTHYGPLQGDLKANVEISLSLMNDCADHGHGPLQTIETDYAAT